ncbi:MAG: hypothetical protein U0237_14320 [Thermoleophilia bacterium]
MTFALLPAVAAANPKPVPVTDLEIAKTADRAEAAPGDAVTWTVTVRNAGTAGVPLALIAVDDPGAVLTPAGPAPSGDVLRPGESVAFTGQTAVTAETCPALSNTATVRLADPAVTALNEKRPRVTPKKTSKKGQKGTKHPAKGTKGKGTKTPPAPPPAPVPVDVNPANDTATATVAVTCPPPPTETPAVVPPPPPTVVPVSCPVPRLQVGIVAPRRVRAGRTIRVAVTVHNASPAVAASGVVARYTLPRGTALARMPHGARVLRGRSVVLRVASLAPGASRTVRMLLRPTTSLTVNRRGHRAQARERCTATRTAVTATQVQNSRPRKRVPRVTG